MGMRRATAAVAVGLAGAGLLAGCGWSIASSSYTDDQAIGETVTSVRFANDSGNMTIRVGDETTVHRTVHHGGDKPGEGTVRVRNEVLHLDPCGEPDCWIDYEVTVPAGTAVSGQLDSGTATVSGVAEVNVRASSGEVTVEDVAGAVNIESASGSVNLIDIGGAVVAKAESGNVHAEDVRGDVTLQAASGNVEARGIGGAAQVETSSGTVVVELTAVRDVRVTAASGNVDVTVPDGAYRVTTGTDSGDVDSDVTDDTAGHHHLDLHTDSGNITVTRA